MNTLNHWYMSLEFQKNRKDEIPKEVQHSGLFPTAVPRSDTKMP